MKFPLVALRTGWRKGWDYKDARCICQFLQLTVTKTQFKQACAEYVDKERESPIVGWKGFRHTWIQECKQGHQISLHLWTLPVFSFLHVLQSITLETDCIHMPGMMVAGPLNTVSWFRSERELLSSRILISDFMEALWLALHGTYLPRGHQAPWLSRS